MHKHLTGGKYMHRRAYATMAAFEARDSGHPVEFKAVA